MQLVSNPVTHDSIHQIPDSVPAPERRRRIAWRERNECMAPGVTETGGFDKTGGKPIK